VLHLQKPEETSNRFFRVRLAFVFVIGFPNELWFEERIKDCFRGFAEVAEIDPVCLSGENFGPLRLLLEVNDRLDIRRELRISYRRGVGRLGAVATVHPIRVWPREFQLDSRGNLATFFGPPAPPGAGPSLGPMGPMTSNNFDLGRTFTAWPSPPTARQGLRATCSGLSTPFAPWWRRRMFRSWRGR
jgi:hypothetical protein